MQQLAEDLLLREQRSGGVPLFADALEIFPGGFASISVDIKYADIAA